MLAGQVGVITTNPTLYGRAVQFFTGSKAFHTITAISETECVSAEMPGVRIRPISDFTDIIWTTEPFTRAQQYTAVQFVKRQVGKPYAYFDIILLAVDALLHKLNVPTPDWIRDRVADDHQYFCSELCDAGMEAAGVTLFPGRSACMVTPDDFLKVATREHA